MKQSLTCIVCFICVFLHAQDASINWWNPAEHEFQVIEGQAWPNDVQSPYNRLPARAKGQVRDAVYNLGTQSAGLMIRFRSNASNIEVRYTTTKTRSGNDNSKQFGMDHMPATGMSGLDLYAIDSDGQELWCMGKRQFSDTITYEFQNLKALDDYHNLGPEYRLYLPLYNQVSWLEIGVSDQAHFEALPVRKEKPIVVYGTSIAQGACASRPGMAWTAILGRQMDRPLINLGFSGNGRLEKPVVDLLTEIDQPKIYIIDCLPNLVYGRVTNEELKKRLFETVKQLKHKKPDVPILLVEHAGYSDGFTNEKREEAYTLVNTIQRDAFKQLQSEGYSGLYYLTKEDIGLQLDDTVDGTHPTDLGMLHYAEGYEKKLRSILNEATGQVSTTQPVTQCREPLNYNWEKRHRDILNLNQTNPPKSVIIANSIVQFWGGEPSSKIAREAESWDSYFTPKGLRNFAYGWDRIENVLWRIHHGELDGFEADQILLMIGTNNMHLNTNEEILVGLTYLVKAIQQRQAKSEIILMGILPRRDYEDRISHLNFNISRLANTLSVRFADLGSVFLHPDNKVNESLFSDGLHPNTEGYLRMRDQLNQLIK